MSPTTSTLLLRSPNDAAGEEICMYVACSDCRQRWNAVSGTTHESEKSKAGHRMLNWLTAGYAPDPLADGKGGLYHNRRGSWLTSLMPKSRDAAPEQRRSHGSVLPLRATSSRTKPVLDPSPTFELPHHSAPLPCFLHCSPPSHHSLWARSCNYSFINSPPVDRPTRLSPRHRPPSHDTTQLMPLRRCTQKPRPPRVKTTRASTSCGRHWMCAVRASSTLLP